MKLKEIKAIVDSLVETHGGELEARFKYKFASGRVGQGPITGYTVRPSKPPMSGSAIFTIDYARGEEA